MEKQQIRDEMDDLAEKIGFLEDSKFMNNRLKVSQMNKRWKELQNKLFDI